MAPQNIHANHRIRMKQNFLRNNGSLYPHQLLEILLFYTIPRADTNPIAYRLLNRFSCLGNVMNASVDELSEIEGVGPASACFIHAAGEICRRYSVSTGTEPDFISADDLKSYFTENFSFSQEDTLLIVSIGSRLELIHSESISLKLLESTPLSARHIAEIILRTGSERIAAGIFHKNQPAVPSENDYRLTKTIAETAAVLGTEITDMIIYNHESAFSMRETGAFGFSVI